MYVVSHDLVKDVLCYELFGGIALKNHAFSFHYGLNGRRDGMQAGQIRMGWSHVVICRRKFRVRGEILMIPDHTAFWVRCSG